MNEKQTNAASEDTQEQLNHNLEVQHLESSSLANSLSRRSFLKVGSLAMGGLALPQLLRAEERSGKSHKSVIMVYLSGGLAHQDTFDLKPSAPPEIRGEFNPIATNVPGIHFTMKDHVVAILGPTRAAKLAASGSRSGGKLDPAFRPSTDEPDSIRRQPAGRPFLSGSRVCSR